MRKLARPRVPLPTIVAIDALGTTWLASGVDVPADGKWNNADVRGALFAMHGRSCAYCQKELTNSRGDVDHFRPQSIYPWLKYNFTNYLMSCDTCNSIYKVAKFPLRNGVTPWPYARAATLANEPRMLLDPSLDDVERFISFEVKDHLCKVIVAAQPNTAEAALAESTIKFFDLNYDSRLIKTRKDAVNDALFAIDTIMNEPGLSETKRAEFRDALQRAASRYRPYGIAIRAALEKFAPDLLPTRKQEVLWLVEECLVDLAMYDDIRRDNPDAERQRRLKREESETCYAIAVLMKEPPPDSASREEIAALVRQANREEKVAAYLANLG
jgi:uncharacterized protein (TIGR02646 family)